MTPQAKIRARILELAGQEQMRVSVNKQKGEFYTVLSGGFSYTRSVLFKLFPEALRTDAYRSPWGGPCFTYLLLPESAVEELLQEMEFYPAWNRATVASLARGIRDTADFTRLPVLADALEEAGCTNQHMLNHCRASEPHNRSCWVVDLVLGTSK